MEESFMRASFEPPAVDLDGASPSLYPSLVLLDTRAYIADRVNGTTAKAATSTGFDFKVTFFLADPPFVSYFCVYFPGINIEDYFTTEPRVVSSAEELTLLCFSFRVGPWSPEKEPHHLEYFVYEAGGTPTIRSVPRPPRDCKHSSGAAIVPLEGNGFLVADLSPNGDLGNFNLHIFSSETNKWSTKQVQLKKPPGVLPWKTDKVISLGEGMVGWVNLWCGIVVCDVLQKDPVVRFLPLPKADYDVHRGSKARSVRDVTGFPNGFIKFVEIEHCFKWSMFIYLRSFETTTYLDIQKTIRDTDILRHNESDIMEDEIKYAPAGWKIRTCFRSISWNHWKKGHIVHVNDISADPRHCFLLVQLWDSRTQKCKVRNLRTSPGFPTFTGSDGEVVCLMSKIKVGVDEDTWILGVNLNKKSLEFIVPYCASRATCFDPTFISCAFSKYLNTTPFPRPCDEEVAAESAQNGVLTDHLSSGDTVPNNVRPHTTQDTTATISSHPVSHSSHPVGHKLGSPCHLPTSTQLVPSNEMCEMKLARTYQCPHCSAFFLGTTLGSKCPNCSALGATLASQGNPLAEE